MDLYQYSVPSGLFHFQHNHATKCIDVVSPSEHVYSLPVVSTAYSYYTATPSGGKERVTGSYNNQGFLRSVQLVSDEEPWIYTWDVPSLGYLQKSSSPSTQPKTLSDWIDKAVTVNESTTSPVETKDKVVVSDWVVPDWD